MRAPTKLKTMQSREQGQISCFDIEVFHLNQRRSRNPKYDEIKESVRCKGIQDPLHIVFHPGQQKWVLSQGGQTRLLICRELYEETQDDSYLYPPLTKQKFTSDLDLSIRHLVENNLRGGNTFLETANAVLNIRRLLVESLGADPTQDDLANEMSSRGMPIRRQSITAMLYLAEELSPYITNQFFLDSVSRKVIDTLRSLRNELVDVKPHSQFDSELVTFINAHNGSVSLKQIQAHFQTPEKDSTPTSLRSNRAIATNVLESFGLVDVVHGTDNLPSGYVVAVPQHIESPLEAEVYFLLISLSGALDGQVTPEVLEEMGVDETCVDPEDLASIVRVRLNLTSADLSILPSKVFCHTSEEGFESLIRLIVGVRTSLQNNNQSLEN
ncbi:hypothetical protein ACJJI4_24045 (plasmid) [Microbulbifer sp. TRSA002]|uniref:hypothetical protein n=1 Tax=Microbulbifer sp. TRSA002 TaxID=3243382 RepID=UPI0040396091